MLCVVMIVMVIGADIGAYNKKKKNQNLNKRPHPKT
jgi:uncharacterized membrane protein